MEHLALALHFVRSITNQHVTKSGRMILGCVLSNLPNLNQFKSSTVMLYFKKKHKKKKQKTIDQAACQ